MGDSRGIGPEVITRALSRKSIREFADFLVIGNFDCIRKTKKSLKVTTPLNRVNLWEIMTAPKKAIKQSAINILSLGGRDPQKNALDYIESASMLIQGSMADGLVTAPVNKKAIASTGIKFSGHTEYLAALTNTKNYAMMFVGKQLKATIVTRHIPLKDVNKRITTKSIISATMLTHSFLKSRFKIKNPRISICAFNPHAGEGGTIGREEAKIIAPAVKALKKKIENLTGPIPADSAFNLLYNKKCDCLISMYHDQAMIPVKMVGRASCVNVTLGLPFVRTSPVHGTAYDIAGKGIADPSSMIEAMKLAANLASKKIC